MKQVEVFFSPIPDNDQREFMVRDSEAKAGMIAIAQIAYDAPIGKDIDELEMDQFDVMARVEEGKVFLLVTSLSGPVHDNFKVTYSLNGSN